MTETLILAWFICLFVFVAGCNTMIYLFFKKGQEIATAMSPRQVLKLAQELYTEGRYDEGMALITRYKTEFTSREYSAEANRLLGWNYYYLAIKGPVATKEGNLKLAELAFWEALKTRNKNRELSCLNGLPLVLWILDKKPETWSVINKAVKRFPEEPSVWNTMAITLRRDGEFIKSIEVCEKLYGAALAKGDPRTAGHAKQNKADALRQINKIRSAKIEYKRAIELYKLSERAGMSAEPHIKSCKEKLATL